MAVTQEIEQTQDTECMQQIRKELHHAKRIYEGVKKLHGEQIRDYNELLAVNRKLEDTLARTSRKSKGRLKSIRGLEQALRMERLRHGYIVPEDMTPAQSELMHMGIAHYKAQVEVEQRERDNGESIQGQG